MAISEKTRKRLWAASGGRCAKCRCRLVAPGTPTDDDAVAGDECHIVGRTRTSARGDELPFVEDVDGYENLILLCAADHRLIDAQPYTFTSVTLRQLKRDHERWVHETLEVKVDRPDGSEVVRTIHVLTGKQLLDAVLGREALHFDYCEPNNETEMSLIAELSDQITDWLDIGDDLQGGGRVRVGQELSSLLLRLGAQGMLVWTGELRRRIATPTGPMPWRIAVVLVRRMSQDEELIADHLREIAQALEARRQQGDV